MIPLNLDSIINAISSIASPLIKDKLQRNETVIKILKQFNLAPEHPPADFSGVYAYALYVGGNAATLLVKVDKKALDNKNLSRAVIIGANFSDASLRGVNFAEANLANTVFAKVFGAIFTVTFSPDGKLFATGDATRNEIGCVQICFYNPS